MFWIVQWLLIVHINERNVLNCPNVVIKKKNKQKNTTLSEQFQNQLLVFWYFTGLVQVLQSGVSKFFITGGTS
jgi:hypothetical protein